ncbi:hypothetical protein C8P64_0315 [Christiangramia gaetbulicola]|uniref:TonB-dependent receptor-like protein n=1 Tax=Christiangramia gaetbulicola TaxID=703340 RepID=A0A2T6AKI9_9FLAO|nr:hypothetical protein [Christiangramia gaetbulicola]PTX44338.1 hypothetical protein C8P64_0315 [Christiangramia gaetbulicola]
MLKITPLILLILFSFSVKTSAQEEQDVKLQEDYTNYFSNQDKSVYLHLNKTTFLPKEELWFAAYTYQPFSNIPDLKTTNLQVALFDERNRKIISKVILANGGKGTGFLNLKKLRPGTYNLVASQDGNTSNFFQQPIRIISGKSKSTGPRNFDLQLLPEGGHLLADTENSVGFKVLDSNGEAKEIEGFLLDEAGDTLKAINSNQFGMGKFQIVPKSGKSYRVVTMIDSIQISTMLPDAKTTGINLSIERLGNDYMARLNTNKQSLDKIDDENFKMVIHNGSEIKKLAFKFEKDELRKILPLKNEILFNGINIVTVFDEDFNPLVERMIYKDIADQRVPVSANFVKSQNDSLVLNVSTTLDSLAANSLSISVLPAENKSYHPKHNLISHFELKPYVKGNIEHPEYYFASEVNLRRRLYDLDLLLLNQGWSKYEWPEIFEADKTSSSLKNGFTLQGTVNNDRTEPGDKVFLKSDEIGLFEIVDLDENKSFELSRLFILDSTNISIGVTQGKKQKIIKPKLYVKVLPPNDHFSNLRLSEEDKQAIFDNDRATYQLGDYRNFIRTGESLDTITVTASRKKEMGIENNGFGDKVEMNEETKKQYLFVTSYISMNGFKVRRDNMNGQVYIYNRRFGRLFEPVIQLDGVTLVDYSILYNLQTSDVESIYINQNGGAVMGKTSFGGIIRINTLSGQKRANNSGDYSPNTYEFLSNTGFARDKEFYTPQYRSYTDDLFNNYGVIDWKNNISLNEDGKSSFKILNTLQNKVDLFIEGMTVDGKLISEKITLELN